MEIPDYFDVLPKPQVPLGTFGHATIEGLDAMGMATEATLVIQWDAPGVRVYDLWARVGGAWVQLNPAEADHAWTNDALHDAPVTRVRLWAGRADGEVLREPPMPTEEAIPIPRVRTQRSEPPLPEERIPPRLQPWVDEALDDVVIGGILLEWTEVVNHASAAGWGLGVPPGEAVFTAFIASGEADPRGGATDRDFARWLLGALGREVRAALVDRRSLEHLSEHIRSVLETGVRLARAVDASAQIVLRVPPSIGPSDRFRWLVDEGVATMLGNPPSELHRPLVMIRPLLLWDGEVAIEGLVA